jgi:hypothetical protein
MHTYICNEKRNFTIYNIFLYSHRVCTDLALGQARYVPDIVHIGKL